MDEHIYFISKHNLQYVICHAIDLLAIGTTKYFFCKIYMDLIEQTESHIVIFLFRF